MTVVHQFPIGAKVIFTNDYGVCFGVKTITGHDTRTYDLWGEPKTIPTYHYEGSDTPWYSVPEENFRLADADDLTITRLGTSSRALELGDGDTITTLWRYMQDKYGRPVTREERAALLDTDPFAGEEL